MNPSGNYNLIKELSVVCSIGADAAKQQPTSSSIWENIKTGKEIVEFIGDISQWGNYDRDLEEYSESLARKKEDLCCIEQDLKDEVENIEFQTNRKRKREVENWLKNARAKADDLDKVQEEMKRKNCASKFLFRAWHGKCLKAELEDVNELIKQREAFGAGAGLVLEANIGTIHHELGTSALVGKASADKKLDIWTKLSNPKVRIVGILGEQGMGKTTIMANLYNEEIAGSDLFKHALYVSVKEDVNLSQLQAAIGEAMSLHDLVDIQDANRRAVRIQIALKSLGKFLLILDGLSEYFRFTDVGIPIEQNGGKVVVVSRSESVCRKACDQIIRLERLPEEDSEELFMETLRTSVGPEISSDIHEIALQIIRKCGGVPSKIVDNAGSLRGVDDISEWRVRLSELCS